jgi:hypothetical protein
LPNFHGCNTLLMTKPIHFVTIAEISVRSRPWAGLFRFLGVCALIAFTTCALWAAPQQIGLRPEDAAPPAVVATFHDTDSPHDNIVKPVTLGDGRILGLSIFTTGRHQEMFGRFSSDEGRNWSAKQRLFVFPEHVGGFGYFDAFTDRDGEVHIFYLNDGNTGSVLPKSADDPPVRPGDVLDIWYVRSRAKATQWDVPKSIWTGRAGDLLSIIQLKNGRILLPISYMTGRSWGKRGDGFRAFSYVGSFSSSAIYSDDGGNTWQRSPDELVVPVPDLFTIGGVEPVVLQLKDGRVWMLIRTQQGRFYESFSSDGGTRWTAPKPSSILSSESPAALVRLKDQRILMIWNEAQRFPYAYGGRHVLHAALSSDEGRTWTNHREILRDPARKDPPPPDGDWGISYAFPALTHSGKIVFSAWVETGKSRSMFLLAPAWLQQTHQAANFQSGIDDWSVFGTRGVEVAASPDTPSTPVLSIRRGDAGWPSGAVWNFPMGVQGQLRMRVRLQPGFAGDTIGLTDHYSVPFDDRDTLFNVFNLPITAEGRLLSVSLKPGDWHDIQLNWDTGKGKCEVIVDGKSAGIVDAQRLAPAGVNYLRFHPISDKPDGALLLNSVEADVGRNSVNPTSVREHGTGR